MILLLSKGQASGPRPDMTIVAMRLSPTATTLLPPGQTASDIGLDVVCNCTVCVMFDNVADELPTDNVADKLPTDNVADKLRTLQKTG